VYIPAWFPGAKFKREALRSRKLAQEVLDVPFEFVKKEIVCNLTKPAVMFQLTWPRQQELLHNLWYPIA